jgi:hypothetical protein
MLEKNSKTEHRRELKSVTRRELKIVESSGRMHKLTGTGH